MSKNIECSCPHCSTKSYIEVDDGFDMDSRNSSEEFLAQVLEALWNNRDNIILGKKVNELLNISKI